MKNQDDIEEARMSQPDQTLLDLAAGLHRELDRAVRAYGPAILEALQRAGAGFEGLADEARAKMPESLAGMRLGPLAEELRHSAVLALAASLAQRQRPGVSIAPHDEPIADPAERARAVARELRMRGVWAICAGHEVHLYVMQVDDLGLRRVFVAQRNSMTSVRAIADEIQREEARRAAAWAGDKEES